MVQLRWLVCLALLGLARGQEVDELENSVYKLEGKVVPPDQRPKDWFWKTKVVVEGGVKVGFVKVRGATFSLWSPFILKYFFFTLGG